MKSFAPEELADFEELYRLRELLDKQLVNMQPLSQTGQPPGKESYWHANNAHGYSIRKKAIWIPRDLPASLPTLQFHSPLNGKETGV